MKKGGNDMIQNGETLCILVGAVISVSGAYLSNKEYRRIKNISSNILEREKPIELKTFLDTILKPLESQCISYATIKKGRNSQTLIKKLQNMLSTFNTIKAKMDESKPERAMFDKLYNSLMECINKLNSDKLDSDKNDIYNEVLYIIREFISLIKAVINRTQFY